MVSRISQDVPLADALRQDIRYIAGTIGPRHLWNGRAARLRWAAMWINQRFRQMGYAVKTQRFAVPQAKFATLERDFKVENIEVEIEGSSEKEKIIVVGAHYDTFPLSRWDSEDLPSAKDEDKDTPGANDNGSGIAAILALAKHFTAKRFKRTVRFVAFVNEEPPFFRTDYMGSKQYAHRSRELNEDIVVMMTPETIGCYKDKPDTKGTLFDKLSYLVYWWQSGMPPDAKHVAFLTDSNSYEMARRAQAIFQRRVSLPARAACLSCIVKSPMTWPIMGWPLLSSFFGTYERDADRRVPRMPIGFPTQRWSDDASFWEYGYKAFAITDTAFLRYDDYHGKDDKPDNININYELMAQVVEGMKGIIEELAIPHSS